MRTMSNGFARAEKKCKSKAGDNLHKLILSGDAPRHSLFSLYGNI